MSNKFRIPAQPTLLLSIMMIFLSIGCTAPSSNAVPTAVSTTPPETITATSTAAPPTATPAPTASPTASPTATTPAPSPTPEPTAAPTSSPADTEIPSSIVGIGILGDSNSDEYRADDNRGGAYAAVTLNWVEQLATSRSLNFGEWGTWDPPRRTGYAYNWALSGATARSMIRTGQHTGLAGQIAAGEVSHAVIYIGGNDFNTRKGAYRQIYDGSLSDAEVAALVIEYVANVTTAVDTLSAAGDVQIIVVAPGDPGLGATISGRFSDPDGRQRVTDAINEVNERIRTLAENRENVTAVYLNDVGQALLDNVNDEGKLDINGLQFDPINNGNNPLFLRLGDLSGHPGTVLSGILANVLFIEPMNNAFGYNLQPLSTAEILQNAGLP